MRIGFRLMMAVFVVLLATTSFSVKPAYHLFTKDGKSIQYKKILKAAQSADVVLFGELHNNPISHWLELSLMKDLYALKKDSLMVGAEMFETDDEAALNEYLKGSINSSELGKRVELWNNFNTDYKPLLDYAAQCKIPFAGTNIPRKYARLVARKGMIVLDSLPAEEKKYFPPLPIEVDFNLPGYKNMAQEGIHGHSMWNSNFMVEAQAVKDATMAHTIYNKRNPGTLFMHINGAYHSDNFEGIYWFLKKKNPSLKIVTISTVEQSSILELTTSNKGKADFIIVVTEDMIKTY